MLKVYIMFEQPLKVKIKAPKKRHEICDNFIFFIYVTKSWVIYHQGNVWGHPSCFFLYP